MKKRIKYFVIKIIKDLKFAKIIYVLMKFYLKFKVFIDIKRDELK
jgi:hypothetical protein